MPSRSERYFPNQNPIGKRIAYGAILRLVLRDGLRQGLKGVALAASLVAARRLQFGDWLRRPKRSLRVDAVACTRIAPTPRTSRSF
jgi:hypothetical protein